MSSRPALYITKKGALGSQPQVILAHGRWFSLGTPASSTTKTGRHDIAEILLKVAINTNNQIKSILSFWRSYCPFNEKICTCTCNSYILNGNSSNFERLLITLHITMEVSSDIFLRVFRIFHQKGCTNKSSIFHMGITISFSKEKECVWHISVTNNI